MAANSQPGWSSVSREELLSGVCLAGSCCAVSSLDSWDQGGRPVEPAWWLTHVFLFLVDRMPYNYIRVLQPLSASALYVCGTNAFQPACDHLVRPRRSPGQ